MNTNIQAVESTLKFGSIDKLCLQPNPIINIALYSHDTLGLGHLRRNVTIATAIIKAFPQANILLISGVANISDMRLPKGIDFISLPSVHKNICGEYSSKNLSMPLDQLISIRSQIIKTAIEAFKPNLFVVDNVPRGVQFELDETLIYLRSCTQTKVVLGLRDILDSPDQVKSEWSSRQSVNYIHNYFDRVWIYGDPDFYNPIVEYNLKSISNMTSFTGYFSRITDVSAKNSQLDIDDSNKVVKKSIVCLIGGGQDGEKIAKCFAQVPFLDDTFGILVTGPFFPEAEKTELLSMCSDKSNFQIIDYHAEPTQLIEQAHKVIGMCGYNTVSEVLSYSKPALFVPRITTREEQKIRAYKLKKLGISDVIHPDDLTPELMHQWIRKPESPYDPLLGTSLNFDGLEKVVELTIDLLNTNTDKAPLAISKSN